MDTNHARNALIANTNLNVPRDSTNEVKCLAASPASDDDGRNVLSADAVGVHHPAVTSPAVPQFELFGIWSGIPLLRISSISRASRTCSASLKYPAPSKRNRAIKSICEIINLVIQIGNRLNRSIAGVYFHLAAIPAGLGKAETRALEIEIIPAQLGA